MRRIICLRGNYVLAGDVKPRHFNTEIFEMSGLGTYDSTSPLAEVLESVADDNTYSDICCDVRSEVNRRAEGGDSMAVLAATNIGVEQAINRQTEVLFRILTVLQNRLD